MHFDITNDYTDLFILSTSEVKKKMLKCDVFNFQISAKERLNKSLFLLRVNALFDFRPAASRCWSPRK